MSNESVNDSVALLLRFIEFLKMITIGNVLVDEAISVLVEASIPRVVLCREAEYQVAGFLHVCVTVKLLAIVVRYCPY